MSQLLASAARLHILHHTEVAPIDGAWMAAELARHGYDISAGTLRPVLHQMHREGLLTVTDRPEPPGPALPTPCGPR